MPNKENNQEQKNSRFGNTHLLQIAVVLLAAVSFFTTANGMSQYIFSGNMVIAYAASAAIQGILLSLSMNLPNYVHGIWKQEWMWPIKLLLCMAAFCLTGVAVFCSSWFSYIYIAEVIHQDSWGTDSELLVRQAYRSELYDAQEYARAYRIYLEDAVGEKILLIEEQATLLQDNMVDFGLNWDDEEETYVVNGGAAAASYMAPVIDAMRKVASDYSSKENRDLAAKTVEDATNNISARISAVQQNLDDLDRRITMYENQITSLSNRIRNATEGTDTTALSNAINNYTQLINNATQQQTILQTEQTQLNNALLRLPVYESFLGLNSSTSAISIRNALMQMQAEFFKQEPDETLLLEIATNIFESLRSGAGGTSKDSLSYTNLLVQMNQLIRNLTDYSEIKDIEHALDDLITELRTTNLITTSEFNDPTAEPSDSSESIQPTDSPEPTESIEPTEPVEPTESLPPIESEQPTPSLPDPSEPNNVHSGSGQWQQVWGDRLERLKAQISAMPTYSESDAESGSNTIFTTSQVSILRDYDRNESSKTLDDITRRYVSNHSAIYQGIIYLQSPYRSLAIFALILAFSFDLAGFVFGVVISGNPQQENRSSSIMSNRFATPAFSAGQHRPVEWTILETKNHYKVLTGDYECIDGTYYYKVFCNGVLAEWPVEAEKAGETYTQGIYNVDIPISRGAKLSVETKQELLFCSQEGGPIDGVLRNCQLFYDGGSLIKEYEVEQKKIEHKESSETQKDFENKPEGEEKQRKKRTFVASIDEYVPVHIYNPKRGENQTVPAVDITEKNKLEVEIAVIALNETGTRVAAIYVIGT